MGIPMITMALTAASSVAEGVGAYQAGKAEQEQARINAFIGKTRAVQTDASARENLNAELGTLRNTFSANGQRPTVGTDQIFQELRRVRSRDRRIEFGNRMQEASAYNMQAQAAGQSAKMGLMGGFLKAAPSMFDMYDMEKKRRMAGGN